MNEPVDVSWSRQQDTDPTSVLMVVENLIGGEKYPLTGEATDSSSPSSSVSINFPDAGYVYKDYSSDEPDSRRLQNFPVMGSQSVRGGSKLPRAAS